ncbi:enoyl-CoA hydratase-related protein [Mesorhizobium sp. SB112]|uniref:enoyl-CoA hydratase-related protein n=1 Tax=Mesorhizobium sp. SB112 TaxID=3151853 RepID=UPI0032635C0F
MLANETIQFENADGVAILTINRLGKKNAITHEMWIAIRDLVAAAGNDGTTRALIIRGAGKDFSAGADITEFAELRGSEASGRDYELTNSQAFAALRNSPVPVIAAIRGTCIGGGFGVAAAADIRIATADAVFAVPAAKLGLAYPADAMADIVHATGEQMARYLTFTGLRIDAAKALSTGFLLEIVDDEELDARALFLAKEIAAHAPLSVRASKAAIGAVLSGNEKDAENARRLGDITFASADYAEGRAAFLQRRKPVFKGN